jgi:hypothetical protein
MSRHVVAIAAAVVSLLTTSCGSGSTGELVPMAVAT